jgi:GDP-L-fucose synthase
MLYPLKNKKVWIAGHNGMVGSAIHRRLERETCEIITVDRSDLDCTRQADVENWLSINKPDCIFLAAARVGGIHPNNEYPAEFIYENLAIQTNIIHAAYKNNVEKLLFLGSSCIYPKNAHQPLKEEYLLTGELEPTNEAYAIAKIAGIKMCQSYRKHYGCDFISVMPCNLYGPGDNYHPYNSHVVAALIRRFHEAKEQGLDEISIWGTGKPLREFMHVDDLADACIFLMQNYSDASPINVGTGEEISIQNFAELIADIVGFKGAITNDLTKPDGTMRKVMDCSKLKELGWSWQIKFIEGLKQTYRDFSMPSKRLTTASIEK